MQASAVDYVAVATSGSDGDVSGLKSLRVLRALRLVKMARLIRASRIVKRWETRIEFNYSAMAVMRSMGGSVIVMHWVACAWVMQVRSMRDRREIDARSARDRCEIGCPDASTRFAGEVPP